VLILPRTHALNSRVDRNVPEGLSLGDCDINRNRAYSVQPKMLARLFSKAFWA
jgi:hypothetical protein